MKAEKTVLMARHGQIQSNLEHRYAGWSDEPLTPRGRTQAVQMGRSLAPGSVAAVRTSVIARAHETAGLVAEVLGVPLVEDADLNEMRMGPWEGLTEKEVSEQYPRDHRVWMDRPDELRLAGRESLSDLADRVSRAIGRSIASNRRELLVTHVALIRVALLSGQGRPLSQYKSVSVPNCECFDVSATPDYVPPLGPSGRFEVKSRAGKP